MAKQLKLRSLQLWFFPKRSRKRFTKEFTKGFTLVELLVALFIGGVIVTLLLFTVVQLLQTNQREAARSDTQREMQMALDYISRDLREAVYVYDANCLATPTNFNPATLNTCPGLLPYLPADIATNAENLPVLAFWRVDALPQPLLDRCENNANAFSSTDRNAVLPPAIQGVPCISSQMYTLVVYSLNWRAEEEWRGKARIRRYQIPQFVYNPPGSPPDTTLGWYYPAGQDTDFSRWPLKKTLGLDGNPVNLQLPPSGRGAPVVNLTTPNQVLVDFVDKDGVKFAADTACPRPNNITDPPPAPGPSVVDSNLNTRYTITPAVTPNIPRGFYVCVKGAANNGTLNQEVVVRIQGNAAGRPGIGRDASLPIPMETRVLTRGVVNKI
ncbi:MAG: prepilin-type N-terminal cleavage/methylation domain-containing protein [Leptolyngbyaceae cyanobacterium CSU_1_3]|nr:prepilin-type N-terminal cleavage/methylation domain-containing protein [Leptolyngbyaceae cyanobacterium CSU_1_3]